VPKVIAEDREFPPEFGEHGGLKTVAFTREKVGSGKS
jgi:hypothetical protein